MQHLVGRVGEGDAAAGRGAQRERVARAGGQVLAHDGGVGAATGGQAQRGGGGEDGAVPVLLKRLVAQELVLSFVPDAEQRHDVAVPAGLGEHTLAGVDQDHREVGGGGAGNN